MARTRKAVFVDAQPTSDTLPESLRLHGHSRGHVAGVATPMIGCSPVMRRLFRDIEETARTDAPVLITGERGTGKGLCARIIHATSSRADGPFAAINCAAIPTALIQAELFGYEKGAFAGASHLKIGRLEAAHGGTIFLNEIGDLPLQLQAHLLRFLEEKQIHRIGAREPVPVDARVISTTHANLERAVATGRFRDDLHHRLNVLHIRNPALRSRSGDVAILARHFLHQFTLERRRPVRGFTREAMEMLNRHDWPGNVRELINRIRRAVVMCEGGHIGPKDLDFDDALQAGRMITLDEARELAEREAVMNALERNAGNVARAARELDVSRVTLYRLIEKHQARQGRPCRAG